jgi:hypothetical protein
MEKGGLVVAVSEAGILSVMAVWTWEVALREKEAGHISMIKVLMWF